MSGNFPLLDEIDEQTNSDNIDWNQNAFQTLLTSNLPMTTVHYYAVDVGLRRLESSLYETYWDVTIDALNDLSHFLFNIPATDDVNSYLYEAKCQLLMCTSIAMIKQNIVRRRSMTEARLSCAAMCLLLLEQSKSYEMPSVKNQYSSCLRSMRFRYLKRTLIAGQWLPTLSQAQFDDIYSNHEQYIGTMIDHLFSAVSLREKINGFIDDCLLNNDHGEDNSPDSEATSRGFVLIRRFPKYNEKTIDKHSDLLHLGFVHTLNQLNRDNSRKLIYCVWILCCMIEADRVSLEVFNHCLTHECSSAEPIDFEQRPITSDSLDKRDIVVFLLLCAQQNIRPHQGDSILHPYLLYSSSSLCTQQQNNWWQTAVQRTSWVEFVDHLATIRLADEKVNQHPPNIVLLEIAKILFKTAQTAYKQNSNRSAVAYEQYAIQYFQTGKAAARNQGSNDLSRNPRTKREKLLFFYPQPSIYENNEANNKLLKQLIEQCERLARQCDELKLLPEPPLPKAPSPTKEEKGFFIADILSPIHVDQEDNQSSTTDSTIFATPTSNQNANVSEQIPEQISLTPPPSSPTVPMPAVGEASAPSLSPLVNVIFSHMNSVNQWINRFYVDNEGLQNDVHTIRDRLERLNRATSQMIFSNVKIFQPNSDADNERFPPPRS